MPDDDVTRFISLECQLIADGVEVESSSMEVLREAGKVRIDSPSTE